MPDDNGAAITGYRIHIELAAGFPATSGSNVLGDATNRDDADGIIEVGASARSYSHKGLTESTTYRYVVYAENIHGFSNTSNERGATTPAAGTPDAPGNLKAVLGSANAVSLYWTWPTNLRGGAFSVFQVAKSTDGTFDQTGSGQNEAYEDASASGASQHNDSAGNAALANGSKIYYRVRTVTLRADGITTITSATHASITVTVPTPDDLPGTPTVVSASTDKLRQIDLAWNPNATTDTTTGYLVEAAREVADDTARRWMAVPNGDIGFSDPTYNHYDLEPGQGWDYRVFPRYRGNYGLPLDIDPGETKAAVTSDPVENLEAEADGPTKIKVTWDAPAENGGQTITGYRLEIAMPKTPEDDGAALESTWPAIGVSTGAMVKMTDASTRESTLTGLDAGTIRYFRVMAMNGIALTAANQDEADVARGQSAKAGEPGAPEDITAESARDSSSFSRTNLGVLLLWNAPDDPAGDEVTGYKIERNKDNAGWEILAEDTLIKRTYYEDRTHYVDGESWEYRITARSGTGTGPPVMVTYPNIHTTHLPAAADELTVPGQPIPRVVSVGGIKTISILWDSGEGEERQIVQLLTEDRMFVDSQTVMPDGESADFDNDGSGIAPGTYRVQIVALGMGTDFRNSGTVLVTVE